MCVGRRALVSALGGMAEGRWTAWLSHDERWWKDTAARVGGAIGPGNHDEVDERSRTVPWGGEGGCVPGDVELKWKPGW